MDFNNAFFEKSVGGDILTVSRDLPEICFSGRSNVGKSSLINRVLNKKSIARVSSTPGKTVTLNFYRVGDIRLVDLPGYGYAKMTDKKRESFSVVAETYFGNSTPIRLCFQLVDMRRPATDDDVSMLRYLKHYNIKYAIVLTKCDKLNKTEFGERLAGFKTELGELADGVLLIPFSALDGTGTKEIRELIEKTV